jgi:hypothetical protein
MGKILQIRPGGRAVGGGGGGDREGYNRPVTLTLFIYSSVRLWELEYTGVNPVLLFMFRALQICARTECRRLDNQVLPWWEGISHESPLRSTQRGRRSQRGQAAHQCQVWDSLLHHVWDSGAYFSSLNINKNLMFFSGTVSLKSPICLY